LQPAREAESLPLPAGSITRLIPVVAEDVRHALHPTILAASTTPVALAALEHARRACCRFGSDGALARSSPVDEQGTATAPQLTANDTVGEFTVVAQSAYGSVTLRLSVTASGVPAAIAVAGAANQDAEVNGRYARPLQARVTDANGNPVQGATVTFGVVPGATGAGASFLGGRPTATTDANGLATSPPLLASGTPGRFTATASTDGLAAVATYALRNESAVVSIAATSTARQDATVGTRYRQPLRVRVLDASGHPIEGATVAFTIVPAGSGAGGAFAGGATQATATTDADGRAASPLVTANTSAGSFTATASTAGSAHSVADALTNRAAPPSSSPTRCGICGRS